MEEEGGGSEVDEREEWRSIRQKEELKEYRKNRVNSEDEKKKKLAWRKGYENEVDDEKKTKG